MQRIDIVKRLSSPAVAALSLLGLGLVLGMLSWLAPLPAYARDALQIAGLALPLVGCFALGFLWLIHTANSGGARQAVIKTWSLQPVLGFSLGTLGGLVVTGEAYPGSLIGLIAGVLLAVIYRRAAP
jgi:hypothetical protein